MSKDAGAAFLHMQASKCRARLFEMQANSERFQILSLDGGGIKGLFSAAVLAALEEDLRTEITTHFDLIAGTSTGGIIALGLGLGLRPRELVDFYLKEGPQIFDSCFGLRHLTHWVLRKYPQEPLQAALQSCFGNRCVGDSSKRLVIPSYNIGDDDVYIFRTPHHERLRRDYRTLAWRVGLATSAAPTFFPACRHLDHLRLVDGGIWANNPTMVAIIEAVSTLQVPLDSISVFSLGTSEPVMRRRKYLNWAGNLLWARDAIDVVIKGQSLSANNQAKLLLGSERVERLSPTVPDGLFKLDNTAQSKELISMAAHHSRVYSPRFGQLFQCHTSRKFTPIYSVDKKENPHVANS